MARTYTNPVYGRDFPDPFVLRFNGRYYAYGTGHAGDERIFPVLSSKDLVSWEEHGGALAALDVLGAEEYWAPEVAYIEGRFYMYYASGRRADPDHHVRVASSEHPLGPWRDLDLNLTPHEVFAIDAHPFRDPADGQWYLFYARDELEPPYAGTGVVVDRLIAPDRLEGNPRPVLRPYAEWQVFELRRAIKRGLDWYTVEGPFVRCIAGRYVCFYSGGRWENPGYGVGYARADHPLGPWTDDANADGPTVLTTVAGKVIGPGHNSAVVGPDLETEYLVYHAWDPAGTGRYPRIDRLEWAGGRPRCLGPTCEPQPAPRLPDIAAWFDETEPGPEWEGCGWRRGREGWVAKSPGAALTLADPVDEFIAETSCKGGGGVTIGAITIRLDESALHIGERTVPLPDGWQETAWHTVRVLRSDASVAVNIDDYVVSGAALPAGLCRLALTGSVGATLSHFSLSRRRGPGGGH